MTSLAGKITWLLRLELVLLSATWLAGIYINGFVAIIPGTSTETILLTPAVASHIFLASLSAAMSIAILTLAWVMPARKSAFWMLLATILIAIAGSAGLGFVLGGASDSDESMLMATAFITALFLTFLSMVTLKTAREQSSAGPARGPTHKLPRILGTLALMLCYAVFISGIYVNLFVAGPVFSLPLNSERAAFAVAERSAAFVLHESLGVALLTTLSLFLASLWSIGRTKLALFSLLPVACVAYSAYVGSLNFSSALSPVSGGLETVLIPMLSAAAFMGAIVVTMLLVLKTRSFPVSE